ncbi:hypothetical protein F5882DRAFT_458704 [Hyaloscypha sp. PMI_1271]|nr:hypothetical protein F5882DRAFT_458704 [Hyaloscypha sp. PMI_1271]
MFPVDRNAVVGIKPTVGLTSTSGVIQESPSMDTAGPFGQSVVDAAIFLDIIQEINTAPDSDDHGLVSTPMQNLRRGPSTSWLSNKDGLKGTRFDLPWKRVWEIASKDAGK